MLYDLIYKSHDTKLQLNLNKLSNKTQWTDSILNYYILDYPVNYDISKLPHDNTLDSAKDFCVKNNYSGVTFQDGIFQVRSGKYINYNDIISIVSWIYL